MVKTDRRFRGIAAAVDAEEEAALVRRVADGDRMAFHRLVLCHQRPLSAYARRMLLNPEAADDVVQETLLRLWTRADRFDAAAARLTTWLHRIAHNLCIDARRRDVRTVPLEEDGDRLGEWSAGNSESGPETVQAQLERSRRIREALEKLPERQRSALLLCHYQGLSNREAAQVMEVGVEALESLLSRARRRLREDMESEL